MEVTWMELKQFADSKNLSVNWIQRSNRYLLHVFDGYFTVTCDLLMTIPANEDQTDFETNYKTIIGDKTGKIATRKDFSYTTNQTNTIIWTPSVGKKYVVTDFIFNIRNTTLGSITLTIFDETNAAGNILYKANFESGANYDAVCNYVTSFISSSINNSLKITTSGNLTVSGTIQGYEIK